MLRVEVVRDDVGSARGFRMWSEPNPSGVLDDQTLDDETFILWFRRGFWTGEAAIFSSPTFFRLKPGNEAGWPQDCTDDLSPDDLEDLQRWLNQYYLMPLSLAAGEDDKPGEWIEIDPTLILRRYNERGLGFMLVDCEYSLSQIKPLTQDEDGNVLLNPPINEDPD
jgi:hypothetical protein